MSEVVTIFDLAEIQLFFMNYENDARGKISNCFFVIHNEQFQISSDTATYHRLLAHFRKMYPTEMKGVYNAAPKLR